MLNLTHLAHFLAVVRQRNFHRAAEDINLSQSALSRSIQVLEKETGQVLLIRSRTNTELTAAGKIVAVHAETLLREKERMLGALARQDNDEENTIRIGLGEYPAQLFGIAAATALKGSNGRLLCQLRIDDYRRITDDLKVRRIDIGLCDVAAAQGDKRIRILPVEAFQVFGYVRPGHPLLANSELNAAGLFRYPIIGVRTPRRFKGLRNSLHAIDPVTREILPLLNTASPETALKLLLRSDAVAYAPLIMIESLLASKRVALVRSRESQLSLQPGFIHLHDHEPDALMLRYIEEAQRSAAAAGQRSRELETQYGVAET